MSRMRGGRTHRDLLCVLVWRVRRHPARSRKTLAATMICKSRTYLLFSRVLPWLLCCPAVDSRDQILLWVRMTTRRWP